MATPKMEIRTPEPIQTAIKLAAERNGRSFAQEVNATLGEKYLGDADDAPAQVAPRQPGSAKPRPAPANVPGVVKASDLAKVEAGGASMGLAMDRAGIAQWDPSAKRPQYVRGQGKAKGR